MSRPPAYAPLGSSSRTSLPLTRTNSGAIDSGDVSDAERGAGPPHHVLSSDPSDFEDNDKRAHGGHIKLETEEDDDDEVEALLLDGEEREGKRSGRSGRVCQCCSIRTTLLLSLTTLALVALFALFHPSSPYSTASSLLPSSWYSGANLSVGTYNPSAVLAPNPLPSDGKFGDIPFASMGGNSKAHASAVPNWAGGDGGAKEAEKQLTNDGKTERYWNGTHWFEKTVILVSLDGVRADYLEKGLTPHLLRIAEKGLRAEYLQPVFPSLTFPNHWSLATGLYPASHGIVANDFLDPSTGDEFIYTQSEHSWDAKWWRGEPVWSTAVKNGKRSANLMWPGPPQMSDKTRPTFFYPFHNHFDHTRKTAKIASWLDLPLAKRPHLIQAYAPEVDQEGHRSGPHSHKVEETLAEMDQFAKDLFEVLEERNLTEIVDVVFVSDHGMTETHNERIVFLDDILGENDFKLIERNEGYPSAGLRFAESVDTTAVLDKLLNASAASAGGFNVYTPETMPDRWHFSGNERIAPIMVVPHVGWAVSNREEFFVNMKGEFKPKGNHGYDNADPSMHAIFIAHGPFANNLKTTARRRSPAPPTTSASASASLVEQTTIIPGFDNLEIYNLVIRLLGIPESGRAKNNGTEGFWDKYLD